MTKQHIAILVIAFLVAVGLAGTAVYKFDHRAHVPAGISVQQALNERQDAIQALNLERSTAAIQSGQLYVTKTMLQSVCASLKTTKVTNTYCQ